MVYQTEKSKKTKTHINAYLILTQNDHILLHLRQNTGYCDNQYGLVAGHIEDGESASHAIIREAEEEVGIILKPSNLHFAHCLHRQEKRLNVDIFFSTNKWEGAIRNMEPEKCSDIRFFPRNNLPVNTIDYIKAVLESVEDGKSYSEMGW